MSDSLLAFCSVGLLVVTYAFPRDVLPIYALLFLYGVGQGFQGPAASSLMPQLVEPEDFPNAVAWRTTMFQGSAMVGPILGGLILGWHRNPAHVYACTALAETVAVIGFLRLKSYPLKAVRHDEPILQSLLSGIRYVKEKQVILGAMTLDLFAVLFGGVVGLLPIFARDILHVGPRGLGALGSATSVGAILMAFTLVHRPPMRRAGRVMLGSIAVFGLCMIGFGLSRSFALSLLLLALSGAADNVSMVVRSTLIQGMTPNEMRGRVSAVNGVFVGASNELGRMESGLAAQMLGVVPSVLFGGTMTLLVVLTAAWRWPKLRDLGSLEEAVSR
jgi:MFS family permease